MASLAACGAGDAPSGSSAPTSGSEPSSSQGSGTSSVPESSSLPQSGPDASQGKPEQIDLDKMTEEYGSAAQPTDRLSGKNVKIIGYLQKDQNAVVVKK